MIAESKHARIVVANARGDTLHTLQGPAGTLRCPVAIAVARTGEVLVADWQRALIVVFDNVASDTCRTLGDGEGTGPRHLFGPHDLTMMGDEVVVADTDNSRLSVFRLDDTWVRHVGSRGTAPGQFNQPTAVATAATAEEALVVADVGNHRVQVLTVLGAVLRVLPFGALGMVRAVLWVGEVLIASETQNQVLAWDGNGFRPVCAVPDPLGMVATRHGLWVSSGHQLKLFK